MTYPIPELVVQIHHAMIESSVEPKAIGYVIGRLSYSHGNSGKYHIIKIPYQVARSASVTFANEHAAIATFIQLVKSIDATILNPQRVNPHCPNCGCLAVKENPDEPQYNRRYQCLQCKHQAGKHTFYFTYHITPAQARDTEPAETMLT